MESFLPKVPTPALTKVDLAGISTVRVAEQRGEAVFPARHNHVMYVIRHQAVSPEIGASTMLGVGKHFAVRLIVCVGKKGLLAPGASLRNVMGILGNDEPRHPCHNESSNLAVSGPF